MTTDGSTSRNKNKMSRLNSRDGNQPDTQEPSNVASSSSASLPNQTSGPISLNAWAAAQEEQQQKPLRRKRAPNRDKTTIEADKAAKAERKAVREAKKTLTADGEGGKQPRKPQRRAQEQSSAADEGTGEPATSRSDEESAEAGDRSPSAAKPVGNGRAAPETGDLKQLKQARQRKFNHDTTASDAQGGTHVQSEAILTKLGVPLDERYGTQQRYSLEQQQDLLAVKELMLMDCAQRLRDAGFGDISDQVQINFEGLYDADDLPRVPQDERHMNSDGSITKAYRGEKVWLALNQMIPQRAPVSLRIAYQPDGSFSAKINGRLDVKKYGNVDFMSDDREPKYAQDGETEQAPALKVAPFPASTSSSGAKRSRNDQDEDDFPAPDAKRSRNGRHKPMSGEEQTAYLNSLEKRLELFKGLPSEPRAEGLTLDRRELDHGDEGVEQLAYEGEEEHGHAEEEEEEESDADDDE